MDGLQLVTEQSAKKRFADRSKLSLNIKDFGAKGDDATDDHAAIQAAIDQAPRGAVFFFPPGKYRISAPLVWKTGIHACSDRRGFGYLPGAAPSSSVVLKPLNTTLSLTALVTASTNISNAGIQGIDFDGLGTTARGIYWPFAYWCHIKEVHMNNFLDPFIQIDAGNANTITNFLGVNGLKRPGRTADTGSILLGGSDHWLTNVETGGGYVPGAMTAGQHNAGIHLNTGSSFLVNCIGELSEVGIRIGTTAVGNHFANCRADKNGGDGWDVRGNNNVINACTSSSNWNEGANLYYGFNVTGWGNDIHAHVFAASTTHNKPKYAFFENRDGLSPVTRNDIRGTGLSGTQTFFATGWESTAPQIPNNPKRYTSSLTDLDVDNVRIAWLGNYGATAATITAFSKGVMGQELTLVTGPATAVTIANNATIKTSTGTAKLLSANRAYKFTLYNGVWYENG